eukprot:2915907-Prymnesium_polylepis.1
MLGGRPTTLCSSRRWCSGGGSGGSDWRRRSRRRSAWQHDGVSGQASHPGRATRSPRDRRCRSCKAVKGADEWNHLLVSPSASVHSYPVMATSR